MSVVTARFSASKTVKLNLSSYNEKIQEELPGQYYSEGNTKRVFLRYVGIVFYLQRVTGNVIQIWGAQRNDN